MRNFGHSIYVCLWTFVLLPVSCSVSHPCRLFVVVMLIVSPRCVLLSHYLVKLVSHCVYTAHVFLLLFCQSVFAVDVFIVNVSVPCVPWFGSCVLLYILLKPQHLDLHLFSSLVLQIFNMDSDFWTPLHMHTQKKLN